MTDWLTHLLAALRETQVSLTAEDVADAVWLTLWLSEGAEGAAQPARAQEAAPTPEEAGAPPGAGSVAGPEDFEAPPADVGEAQQVRRGEVYLPSVGSTSAAGRRGRLFRSPTGPALAGALAIARALRPLRQRVASRTRLVFDTDETVRRIAEEGIWMPALRPARDRWLDISLIVDAGTTMGVWRSAAEDLRKLLEWTGAFRSVRVWNLNTDDRPPRLRVGSQCRPGSPSRNPLELVDPGGRSLIVVLTDCVSAAWQDGSAARLLETWGRRGPVALLQVFPEHLWSRTALSSALPVWLSAPYAAAPNARLQGQPVYDWPDTATPTGPPVPVTTFEPAAVVAWARLVAGAGGQTAGFVLEPEPTTPPPALVPEQSLPADVRFARFWRTAAPLARRLAGLLAASPVLSLPVIRLLRQALLPGAGQVHEAEVLLSGLLRVAPDQGGESEDPDDIRYDFHDGVRPLLLDAVPTADALRVLERVSSYVEEHLVQGQSFRALLADPSAACGALLADESPFARIAAEVLQRLGGDYARLVRSLPPSATGSARGGGPVSGADTLPFPGQSVQGERGRESLPHKLERVRRPRVRITYDVEGVEGMAKVELPFVVGVLADLSGQPRESLLPLKERKFTFIDRDNFNSVLEKQAPRLAFRVADRLTDGDTQLAVELIFRSMDDFEPARVAEQIHPLKNLLEIRQRLSWLLSRMEGNDKLEQLLGELLTNAKKVRELVLHMGADGAREEDSLLEQVLASTRPSDAEERERHKDYVGQFLHQVTQPGRVVSADVETNLKHWVAESDNQLSAQLNEIMHHPEFQRLEATWRGLYYLVNYTQTGERLKIRVLNVSKRDLFKDLDKAIEFDQSALFKKVYEEEYRLLGGEPYGLLVGDYEFGRHPEDIALLRMISNVASAAHSPFVAAAAPMLFNCSSFAELASPRDLSKIFESIEYAAWNSFRESEDARYVALTLPHVLARLPYGSNTVPVSEFNYEEGVNGKDDAKYLWMSSAWAYAARVTDAFDRDSWFARTRGFEGGGKVEGLPVHTFPTDDGDVALKCPTEIAISDRRELELSNLGFLPLVHSKNRDIAVFLGAQSCQKPKQYFDPAANANAELSAKFNYLLCVSRFAHYLKVMARDKIGSFMEVRDCERWLNAWITNFVLSNPEVAGVETRTHFPLADARVEVHEVKGKPGWYEAIAWLRPYYQLEGLTTSMRLVVELPKRS